MAGFLRLSICKTEKAGAYRESGMLMCSCYFCTFKSVC